MENTTSGSTGTPVMSKQIEVCPVVRQPLKAGDGAAIAEEIVEQLGYPFRVRITYRDKIARSREGKYEDFRSEI